MLTLVSCLLLLLQSDHENPELVWNAEFRAFLQDHVASFLNAYYSSPSISESESDQTAPSAADKFYVDYFSISPYPIAGNVHLPLFLKNPTYQLRDPLYVLVLAGVDCAVHDLTREPLFICGTPDSLSRACGRNSRF